MDPARELDGFAYTDVPDPEKGAEGYPRMFLENRIYCSRVFRKLHVEVGARQDGLQVGEDRTATWLPWCSPLSVASIHTQAACLRNHSPSRNFCVAQVLHMVLYPRYGFDLPILSSDLVVLPNGKVSLAIIDACPVSEDLSLPPHYVQVGGGSTARPHARPCQAMLHGVDALMHVRATCVHAQGTTTHTRHTHTHVHVRHGCLHVGVHDACMDSHSGLMCGCPHPH